MDVKLPWRLLRIAARAVLTPVLVRLGAYRHTRRHAGRLADVYRAWARGDMRRTHRLLLPCLDARRPSRLALEALPVAAVVALARNEWRQAQNIVQFVAVAYHAEDRQQALQRLWRRLRVLQRRRRMPALPATLADGQAWSDFADGVNRVAEQRLSASPREAPIETRAPAPRNPHDRPLVVVCMTGGLGNQLFQYAAGYRYATRIGGELRLDLRAYTAPRAPREFLLPHLQVPITPARLIDIARAARRRHIEPRAGLDSAILNPSGSVWLYGFWERSVYFAGAEEALRRWYQPRAGSTVPAEALRVVGSARGDAAALVGVHVRRGDRAGGKAGSELPTVPTAYYQAAARRFPAGAQFLVFSDTAEDIEWCRMHLGLDQARTHFAQARDPILDLFTLAACDHLILSNSTFSWWAAWLNPQAAKIVTLPDVRLAYGPHLAARDPQPNALPGWEVVAIEPPVRCFRRAAFPLPGTAPSSAGDPTRSRKEPEEDGHARAADDLSR